MGDRQNVLISFVPESLKLEQVERFIKKNSSHSGLIYEVSSYTAGTKSYEVSFSSTEEANAFVERIKYKVLERHVINARVQNEIYYKGVKNTNANVYISLEKGCKKPTERQIFTEMCPYGIVISVKVKSNYCFCQFSTEEEAQKAIKTYKREGFKLSIKKDKKEQKQA